ncbi:MAG TPA: polysaccharide deacetylase family protein, partial [Actinomycetota bacterium]|nr:polysaccharide deacetylase family protein [Actinomycetota bacterium]
GRTGRTVLRGHRAIRWRARYAGGAKLYPGQYGAALIATDEAGNDRRSAEAPWRVHRKVRAHVYTRLPSAGRRVALTFDDCFREDSWRSILRTLRQRRTDATFFCTGAAAARAPSLLRRTVRDGHVFGSHTWDHARLTTVGRSGTANRIARVGALSWSVARHTTAPYFRPPFGLWDSEVLAGARAASHPRVIMWDVDPRDWTFPGMRTIVRRSVGPARGGSIILLHTIPQTAHALRGIITGLRRKGLRPVTVAELFRAAGYRSG